MSPERVYERWVSKGLKLVFKLLYHQFAWAYDTVAWIVSLGMWKDWVMSVLPFIQGPKVLELGHGPGHLLIALQGAGHNVVGMDESREMGRLAVERLLSSNVSVLCINGYAQFMPFCNSHFDTICATFPSEYILDPTTLSEAYRVLKPGGRLVILPTAWFARDYIPGRLVALVYISSGQPSGLMDGYTKPLLYSGFQVSTEVRNLERSKTLVILALKPRID